MQLRSVGNIFLILNRGASGIVGGSDITFRRHRRVVKSLSVRIASFI